MMIPKSSKEYHLGLFLILKIVFLLDPLSAQSQFFIDETQDRLPSIIDITFDADFGDIDGDGDLDLVVSNAFPTDDPNFIYINNGFGYFTEETESRLQLLFENTNDSEMGDADNDGDLDIITANATTIAEDWMDIFLNDGDGFFTNMTSSWLPGRGPSFLSGADFGDVDSDLDLDIVLSNWGFNKLLINIATMGYSFASEERFPEESVNSNDIVFADVDCDFDLDVFIANETRENQLFINNGMGFFTDETNDRIPIDSNQSNGESLVDIDNDGDLDIFIANGFFPGDNKLWINDGAGHFTDESLERMPIYGEASSDASYGDVDNDGDYDLIIANFASQSGGLGTRVFINDGTGYFGDETEDRFPIIEENTNDVAIGDVDNDGDLDLYVANFGDYPSQEQNRLLINQSTPDSFPPSIIRTFNHSDTGDTTNGYLITSTVWDNISVARGELNVSTFFQVYSDSLKRTQTNFTEMPMFWSGGNLYREKIPAQSSGTTVEYYIKAEDKMGNIAYDPPNAPDSVFSFLVDVNVGIDDPPSISFPKAFSLSQNYPNPFNPSTTIEYSIPDGEPVKTLLRIFDIRGKLITTLVEAERGPGNYTAHWNGRDQKGKVVGSGVYLYRIEAGEFTSVKKMILTR